MSEEKNRGTRLMHSAAFAIPHHGKRLTGSDIDVERITNIDWKHLREACARIPDQRAIVNQRQIMNHLLTFSFIAVCLTFSNPFSTPLAAQSLASDFIKIEVKRKKKKFDVYLKNLMPFDVTVTLDMSLRNLVASDSLPFTDTFKGKEKRKILQLVMTHGNDSGSYQSQYNYTIGNRYAEHDTNYVYQLPYRIGHAYPVVQSYRGVVSHDENSIYAIDFGMAVGTEVCAAREGVVVGLYEKSDRGGPNEKFNKSANYILIRHKDLTFGGYYHLQRNGVLVRLGQKVKRGDVIAHSGQTGYVFGPHLHFEVFKAVDGKSTQSFPVKFETKRGVIREPIPGQSYVAL